VYISTICGDAGWQGLFGTSLQAGLRKETAMVLADARPDLGGRERRYAQMLAAGIQRADGAAALRVVEGRSL